MQAPGPPGGPQAAIGSHAKDTPLGEQLYVPAHIKNNFDVLSFNKIFVSLLAGAATGVVGVTGVKGFLVYLLAHAAMAGLLLLKAAPQPQRFFASSSQLLTAGVFSQTEALTFILFWVLGFNIVHQY